MKRVILLIATNIAVMVVLSIVASVLGLNRFMAGGTLNLGTLLAFSGLIGFGGAFISLLLSKTMAKWSTGARVIENPTNETERWLLFTVQKLASRANMPTPQVAIYDGEANAFATGPSKSNALVAVSTGLLSSMTEEEVEAVLAHEVAHIQNGDMVTLTLIQGVVNTFVFFLARVVGFFVDSFLRRNDEQSRGPGIGYMVTVIVCEIVFGILASVIVMYFSRQREYRADAGAASLMGEPRPMINALRRLGGVATGELPQNMAVSGIAGGKAGLLSLLASHPSIESRISMLETRR
ncbi:protease HtpX [Neisseriaceae bacterium TC5R-5]|nr:protease HtpX [Neisseriaceae bacterium TC5R-5]